MTSSLNGMFNVRPVFWIVLVIIVTAAVGLWRSLHHRPCGNESPRELDEIDTGWAFIGILATGFACGAIFQLWSGNSIRNFVSLWLDEDGQVIAVLITTLVFVGGGFAFLFHLHEISGFIMKKLRRKKPG